MARLAYRLAKVLRDRKEFEVSSQLLRSGTNPAAMVREARFAESDRDYSHELTVGPKEASESRLWVALARDEMQLPEHIHDAFLGQVNHVINLLLHFRAKRGS